MSNFRVGLQQRKFAASEGSVLAAELRAAFPNLGDALCGVEAVDGICESFPPCNITLFVEGESLKFSLHPHDSDDVAFGTMLEPLNGFSGLERDLEIGRFQWRVKKKRKWS